MESGYGQYARVTIRFWAFAVQAVSLILWAGLLATDASSVQECEILLLLPAVIWLIEVMLIYLFTKSGAFAGCIGLLLGVFFVVQDSDWGPAPVFWWIGLSYSVEISLSYVIRDFASLGVAGGLFIGASFVKLPSIRCLLRMLAIFAVAMFWIQCGPLDSHGWKLLSSVPLLVYLLLVGVDCWIQKHRRGVRGVQEVGSCEKS